jgi:uncharacterized protein (TIGR02246 family)
MTQRKVLLCAFALTLALTFTGCQTAPTPAPKTDVAADMAAIKAVNDRMAAAFDSKDVAALAAAYADDAIMMDPDQPAIEGKQAIQAAYEARAKENASQSVSLTFAFTPLETQVAGDWAFDRGDYTVTVTPKSGTPMERSNKYVTIYKRQPDGNWKIYLDISNRNNPPPAAAGEKK